MDQPVPPLILLLHLFLKGTSGNSGIGFYGPDALHITQSLVSKHWQEHKELTPMSRLILSSSITGLLKDGRCCSYAGSVMPVRNPGYSV